jgi:hypothetical protein
MKIKIPKESCDDCPFLWQNMEYPESKCTASKRGWGMGHYERGDPRPDWCPLNSGPVTVELEP